VNTGRAHAAVAMAISSGKLVRPDVCSRCGKAGRIEGHHEDYSKPLEVVWLCARCHKARHTEIRKASGIVPTPRRFWRQLQIPGDLWESVRLAALVASGLKREQISRPDWIVQAIREKLERERGRAKR